MIIFFKILDLTATSESFYFIENISTYTRYLVSYTSRVWSGAGSSRSPLDCVSFSLCFILQCLLFFSLLVAVASAFAVSFFFLFFFCFGVMSWALMSFAELWWALLSFSWALLCWAVSCFASLYLCLCSAVPRFALLFFVLLRFGLPYFFVVFVFCQLIFAKDALAGRCHLTNWGVRVRTWSKVEIEIGMLSFPRVFYTRRPSRIESVRARNNGDHNLRAVHSQPCYEYTSLLRGAILNGAYGTDKNLYIWLILPTIFGPVYYRPP